MNILLQNRIQSINDTDLKRIKEVLVDIDMINDFVSDNPEEFKISKDIVPFHKELLEEHLWNPEALDVFVLDEHTDDSMEFKTFGTHALKYSKGSRVINELKFWYEYSLEFKKNCTNIMMVPDFIELLKKLESLEKIKFIGCLSEICVKNAAITARNYFDQLNLDVDVCVYENGIDTYEGINHPRKEINARAIDDMKMNGVKVLTRKLK